jgi:hypothetical protein
MKEHLQSEIGLLPHNTEVDIYDLMKDKLYTILF